MMNIFSQLKPGTTLLTPNRRLSAFFLKQYHQWQRDQGALGWLTPDILPFSSWLERLWNNYIINQRDSAPIVMSGIQERILWQEILLRSKEHEHLLQIGETAQLAQSAWNLLQQWQIDIQHPLFASSEDYRIFQRWGHEFSQVCSQKNWLDHACLATELTRLISQNEIVLSKQILLMGFTEIPPQHQRLLQQCAQHGSVITHPTYPKATTKVARIALADTHTEILTMAQWAQTLAAQGQQLIGCVVPQLETQRDLIAKIFSEVCANPTTYKVQNDSAPFNISAGRNLAQYPVIHTALQLLKLAAQPQTELTSALLSQILRSPFLGEAEQEMSRRAGFDRRMRERNISSITLKYLLTKQKEFTQDCPALAKRLQNYLTLREQEQEKMALNVWASFFLDLLHALGWPGERSLNSHEFQTVEKWLDLLAEYQTLDAMLPAQTYQQALYYLQQITQQTLFQPQTPDAPIQILGMLEAAGLPFNHLWVMGMDDISWPPAPKPNPFLPHILQKKLQIPHATAERELNYAQQLVEQLTHCSKEVVFSYAEKIEDINLSYSPLIGNIPEQTLADLNLAEFINPARKIYRSRSLELLPDHFAPQVALDEKIRGGTSILKLQAACPFKAFAELRLHARALETPISGLRPQDRGNIVHKALELIWQVLENQETLTQLSEADLQILIQEQVQKALADTTKNGVQYLAIEAQRMQQLLWDWLQLEKIRPDFTVAAREQKNEIKLGTRTYTARIDRIDVFADGSQLIIDYKTGLSPDIQNWFGSRPDEPQLPLYCLAAPHVTTGITFAQVHRQEMVFKGISKQPLGMKQIKTLDETKFSEMMSWEEQLQQWQSILTNLSEDFYLGKAEVDPKDSVQNCRLCDLPMLCRVNEEYAHD